MDGAAIVSDDHLDPPSRLFERLRQIAGYTWDDTQPPFHTSYDIWQVVGTRFVSPFSPQPTASSPGSAARLQSGRPSPSEYPGPHGILGSVSSTDASSELTAGSPSALTSNPETPYVEEPVVARISYHVLREERTFYITKNLIASVDDDGEHIAKPVDLVRLASQPTDRGTIIVAIYQYAGRNDLFDLIDMGPAFYRTRKVGDHYEAYRQEDSQLKPPISLPKFMDFAVGAAQCLEILHYGQGTTHGEIRPDAFHFNMETNRVKLVALGTGTRSFENRLQSSAWSNLSKELGAKNKLLYISPEQTGRMPAEPDSRTDIYSLGIVFWTLLAQRPVFEGDSPLDIVHSVLKGSIPRLSNVRQDVPAVLCDIIEKCTAMRVGDRYHSASGLRHDLVKVRQFLNEGDRQALDKWTIAEKDVSSFFILPTIMIGRQKEQNELLRVIDRVAKSHAMSSKATNSRVSEGSTPSTEVPDTGTVSSEGASSAEGNALRSGSFAQTSSSDPRQTRASFVPSVLSDSQTISGETIASSNSGSLARMARPWERHHSVSVEARSLGDGMGPTAETNRHSLAASAEPTSSSLSRQLGSAKFRCRGLCEIVTIEGVAGLGKSFLSQSVFAEARKRGYFVTAKFDSARRQAFGPLLKLLSSLFKQVFGEKHTNTPFHLTLKQCIRPVWPMLAKMLGLPEHLLGAIDTSLARSPSTFQPRPGRIASVKRRSPDNSPTLLPQNPSVSSQPSQDLLRAGTSTMNTRLMNTYLDVLRMFTSHKFVCFVLDDLHYADSESLELVSQIIAARLKMVIVLTYRPDEISPETIETIINPLEADEYTRSGCPVVTKIPLNPLSENDIVQYVATTLCRPKEEIQPLALVIQSKTAGNPFYMREMLSACYRSKTIWYDYKDGNWHYDLDRLFDQFKTEEGYDVLDTDFITQRLEELPPASRAFLAWASLLGYTFSFDLVCRLMSGEFQYAEEDGQCSEPGDRCPIYSNDDAVAGLQAAVTACILVPGETDDRFRFAHDRYIQASANLKECNARKMRFIIAQTLLKYYSSDSRARDIAASHICDSVGIVKRRVHCRQPFRKLLLECALAATENGARPTAAKYYSTAVALLQPNPWDDNAVDVSYDETIRLHIRAAECSIYINQNDEACELLSAVFKFARTPLDKALAYVLQARIFAQAGDAMAEVLSLEDCLRTMKVDFDSNPTYEMCDREFERLAIKIQTMDKDELMNPPVSSDTSLPSIGAVLAEAVGSAWWSDNLRYYHLALVMLDLHLTLGAYPQSGLAFLYFGIIALSRFSMVGLAVEVGDVCIELIDRFRDPFSMARGYMIYGNFLGHVHFPISVALAHLEGSVEYAATAGDRISFILSAGFSALLKLYASENCADLEAFCQYQCEGIQGWKEDTRGGTLLIAVRQVCRALQGKTRTGDPQQVVTDDKFNTAAYKSWLSVSCRNGNRSILFYETLEIVPLYLYGHYDRAIEMGEVCYANIDDLWSSRNSRMFMFFYGLSLAGRMFRRIDDPRFDPTAEEIQACIEQLSELTRSIKQWEVYNGINYAAWSKMLDGQICELRRDFGGAIRLYEEALDNVEEQNCTFDEALGNSLMAGVFVGRKARRSARAAMKEAVSLYRKLGAVGVANYIEEEHALLLHGPTRNPRTVDAGVQTDFAGDTGPASFRPADRQEAEEVAIAARSAADLKGEQIGAWRGSVNMQTEAGAGLPALDMIDLHAILLSSQVISAVLNVDQLLETMCDVILQTCGGTATLAAIVVRDPQGWCLAASGDPERGAKTPETRELISSTPLVEENVILYCTRFRETLFIPDILNDERFGNVSETWSQRNPLSKAIIAIPISRGAGEDGLLGVLYLEGEPGSFTDRNVSVLQLLVNQIGISYSNSLAMKAVEKVSNENEHNVLALKQTVALAQEAEAKAWIAEAEAKRNVKIAEEASRAKSIFLANVSHELRTPLNGVIGNSELLRESNLNKEQLEMADSIRVSADLLLAVINDILDFSRMEAGKIELYVIAFNPEEMVREVVRAVSYSNRQKTKQKNVAIIQDIRLPSMLIYGDPIRLHQVLGNLINNSLKFTENGSVIIGVYVEKETSDKVTLTFKVQDTGIGIPSEQLKNLFQPFSQGDASTARKYGGSGLGLSICKSLIETLMKGEIKLESEEGVGTTASFSVTFEKAKPDVNVGDAHATRVPPLIDRFTALPTAQLEQSLNPFFQLTTIPKDQIRICIAEDNAINQKIAMGYSYRLGYKTVDTYENGMKAVEGLRQKAKEGQPYHVVLMDVQMPVLDGYEATRVIRREPIDAVRKVLIIAMTASAIQGDREKCLAAGMNDYIAKPVRVDVLEKKLNNYVSPRGAAMTALTPLRGAAARRTASHQTTLASPSRVMDNDLGGSTVRSALPIRDQPAVDSPTSSDSAGY
ncbi:peroxide stress-activated histidine kinase mak2 [Sodiomyces alkalinus F11]|uniref:histidine kinase n=1 Tax=Sodiomyces alkalinus (strain CBS 110278 / VKM F-3762 / F11) TaxID=1314773 RepID=A0A3N2PXX9_SODAK|nr:peroxide stress-activated histidine kinase mak2 [Sodiomyces alkalinus F11]ROT39381.1 peroxide stress-activated histidine kinase mak2 [Sodiomyces alkalinus F11]